MIQQIYNRSFGASKIENQRILTIEILTQIAPNISEVEKIGHIVKLLPQMDTIVSSELDIISA